jgi:DNA repair protein RecO (recombination protein O)
MPFGAGPAAADADGAHRLGHAAYFAELVDEWAPENAANERLFRLGAAVASALVSAQSVDALARYFEYWLLRLEGVYPALDRCPRCGRDTFGEGAVFVVADRAYVCRNCSAGGLKLSAEAVGFLRTSGRLAPIDAAAAAVGVGPLREIEQAHHALMALHLDKELRSARVVRELRPAT